MTQRETIDLDLIRTRATARTWAAYNEARERLGAGPNQGEVLVNLLGYTFGYLTASACRPDAELAAVTRGILDALDGVRIGDSGAETGTCNHPTPQLLPWAPGRGQE